VVSRSRNASGCDAEGETLEDYRINSQNCDHPPAAAADLYENAMQGAIHKIGSLCVWRSTFNMVVDLVTYSVQVCRP
jgi:hypothetical protein